MRTNTRTKLALSASLLLMWVGLISMGSKALFYDKVVLSNNNVTTGSVSLLISNSQNASSTIYDKTREGFSVNLLPGQSAEKYFLLKNASVSDSFLQISVGAVLPQQANSMSQNVTIEINPVDGDGNVVEGPAVGQTLAYLSGGSYPNLGLPIPKGGVQRYRIKTTLAESYSVPLDGVNYDLTFVATQKNI